MRPTDNVGGFVIEEEGDRGIAKRVETMVVKVIFDRPVACLSARELRPTVAFKAPNDTSARGILRKVLSDIQTGRTFDRLERGFDYLDPRPDILVLSCLHRMDAGRGERSSQPLVLGLDSSVGCDVCRRSSEPLTSADDIIAEVIAGDIVLAVFVEDYDVAFWRLLHEEHRRV
tara:strand:+ start:430 stop:948 length:519 start_codon:yes stop_codon:yes gene_type:complete